MGVGACKKGGGECVFGCGECITDLISNWVLDACHQDTGQVTDHRVLILPVVVVLDQLLILLSLCTYSHIYRDLMS